MFGLHMRALQALGFALFLLAACEGESTEALLDRATAARESGHYRASISPLKQLLQSEPDNAEARFLLADSYLQSGQLENAEKEFLRAGQLGLEPLRIVGPLAQVWLWLEKHDRLLDEFAIDESMAPDHQAAIYLARGKALYELGALADAEQQLERSIELDSSSAEAFAGMARIAMDLGDYEAASEAISAALALTPNDFDMLLLKGQLHMALSEFEEAQRLYEKVTGHRPYYITPRLALAQVQVARRDLDEALRHITYILSVVPRHPGANYLRAVIAFQKEDYQTAKRHSELALVITPEHVPSLLIAGLANFALGNLEQANSLLKAALSLDPGHATAKAYLDSTQARLRGSQTSIPTLGGPTDGGNFGLALRATAKVSRHTSGERQAILGLLASLSDEEPRTADSETDRNKRDLGVSQRFLERAIARDPTALGPRLALAEIFVKLDRPERILETLDIAPLAGSDSPLRLALLGYAQQRLGNPAQAILEFRKLVALLPESVEARYLLAVAYRDWGDWRRFEAELNAIVAAYPNQLPARIALASAALRGGDAGLAANTIDDLSPEDMNRPLAAELAGLLAMHREEYSDAILWFKQATNAGISEDLVLKLALAQLLSGDLIGSRRTLESWLKVLPNSLRLRQILANGDLDEGKFQSARSHLRAALARDPDNVVVLNNLAWAEFKLGRIQTALDYAARAYALAPEDPRIMNTYGLVLLESGNEDQALPLLRRAVRSDIGVEQALENPLWAELPDLDAEIDLETSN